MIDLADAASAEKRFRNGTHRRVSPEETVARATALMPWMGATRVANLTGLDVIGLPVVAVMRPLSRSVSVSQGKGLTLAAARASGLMEALELFHAERPRIPLLRASLKELSEDRNVIDVAKLPRRGNATFDATRAHLWASAIDLAANRDPVWVPFSLVHTDWSLPLPSDSDVFLASSNGLASGNDWTEAVIHGLSEIVERDATTLWHCLGEDEKAGTRLALATVDDPSCLEVIDRYRRAGVRVGVWDATTDVGIPSFIAMIHESRSELRPVPIFGGEGAHPAREIALLRALTEAAQSRLTFIAGARDDIGHDRYRKRLDPQFTDTRVARMHAADGVRDFASVPTWDSPTFEGDLAWMLDRVRYAGATQVAVVDLTRPSTGLAVVRVIVPGLEGIHEMPGYVPGDRARVKLRRGKP